MHELTHERIVCIIIINGGNNNENTVDPTRHWFKPFEINCLRCAAVLNIIIKKILIFCLYPPRKTSELIPTKENRSALKDKVIFHVGV